MIVVSTSRCCVCMMSVYSACSEPLSEPDGSSTTIPQRPVPGVQPPLLPDNPLTAPPAFFAAPNLALKPPVDLVNRLNPPLPRRGHRVVRPAQKPSQRDVRAGHLVPALDQHAGALREVEDVAAEVVVAVRVAADDGRLQRGGRRGRRAAGGRLAGGREEGDGEGGEVVGDLGLDEARAVGVGVVCDVGDGGAHGVGEADDFLGCFGVGYFEGCEVHSVLGHEPDAWLGG